MKNFNHENLKFGLKFSVLESRTSGLVTKLFQSTCREAGVITCVQFLEGQPHKIWEGIFSDGIITDFLLILKVK